jgi:hypothetical protein
MKSTSNSRMLIAVTPLMIACVVLAFGASVVAQGPGTGPCSNRTLFGNYGWSSQGQVLPAPGVALPFTSTGVANFDGKGNVSWLEHTVVNGEQLGADWTHSTSGTYTVNPDCTGKMVATTPNSPVPLNIFFSVVQQGKQFYSVANGHAISGVYTRVD